MLADAQEIDMDRPVADRIELHVARQHPLLRAVAGDLEQRGEKGRLAQLLINSRGSSEIRVAGSLLP